MIKTKDKHVARRRVGDCPEFPLGLDKEFEV